MIDRRMIRGVDLRRIVTTPLEAPDVLVRHISHQLRQLWVQAEEMLASVCTVTGRVGLVIAVDRLLHSSTQEPVRIVG